MPHTAPAATGNACPKPARFASGGGDPQFARRRGRTRATRRVLATALAGAALAAVAADGAGAARTLRVTLQLPLSSPLGQNLLAFEERVESASGGEIQVEIYPGAQLYTDREVPAAVASGQIEMGVSSLMRFAGTVPAVDIFSVPFLFDTEALVRAATAPGSPVRAPLDEAMAEKGARPLWWQPYGFSLIMMRGPPARLPGDLEGKKIRTFGKALEAFVNLLGGGATNIAGSRQFLAYERGAVDGGMTGPLTVKDRKLYQVLDSLTLTDHGAVEFLVLIHEGLWRRLPDGERAILTAAARASERELRGAFPALAAAAIAEAETAGMAVHRLDAAERAAWRAATAPLADRYLEAAGALGRRLLEAARSLSGARE